MFLFYNLMQEFCLPIIFHALHSFRHKNVPLQYICDSELRQLRTLTAGPTGGLNCQVPQYILQLSTCSFSDVFLPTSVKPGAGDYISLIEEVTLMGGL